MRRARATLSGAARRAAVRACGCAPGHRVAPFVVLALALTALAQTPPLPPATPTAADELFPRWIADVDARLGSDDAKTVAHAASSRSIG